MEDNKALASAMSALRTSLAAIGGWAVGSGYLTAGSAEAITSVVLVAVPFAWGMYRAWKKA